MPGATFWAGRRVLVTGHTGFKGAWLSVWLREMGAEVSGFSLPPPTTPSLYGLLDLSRQLDSTIGDVRDLPALSAVFERARPQVVFHLAAQALVGESYKSPLETFSTNVVGTAAVLEACRRSEGLQAIVTVTSDKCYENQGWEWGYRETDILGGHDPYSASKGCSEIVAASYRRSFLDALGVGLATARAGNVIGGGDFTVGRLVPDCLAAASAQREVALRYPDSVRPWQHVLDPLSGYLLLAECLAGEPKAWAESWNFGPNAENARPVREVVERCAAAWGMRLGWTQEPGPFPHETAILRLDTSRARSRLGWRPRWDLGTALQKTVDWHKAYLAGDDLRALMHGQIAAYESAAPAAGWDVPVAARPPGSVPTP